MKRIDEINLLNWFKDKFKKSVNKISVNRIRKGNFYSFNYESKLYANDKLPYYDETPLIICLGKNGQYVLGLNLHYVPIKNRKRVINRLQKLYSKEWDANKTLPNITWNKLRVELKYTNFMVKLYIKDRMDKVIKLENNEMEKAISIPSSNFIGISAEKLWKDLGLS